MNDMRTADYGDNVKAFLGAGMLSVEAIANLTDEQSGAITSWSADQVELLIRLYRQTGEISGGVCWI